MQETPPRPRLKPLLAAISLVLFVSSGAALGAARGPSAPPDPRHIANGRIIPDEGYCDQPYIVKTSDGAWLCAITTGPGREGASGQHVITMRSKDQGKTWDKPVDVEPGDGPEASYAVLLKTPGGRIYCFYNHNTDNVREVKREDKGVYKRVDSLGHYVFKYSDDHGRSWSKKRYDIPMREFECDRNNVYKGKLKFFWNVGRPLIYGDKAIMVMHKVGAFGNGFFTQSEGAFLLSPNILTEKDPAKIKFETLPEGDIGLRTPEGGGRVAEEQSIVALSDKSIYCVYRSIDGWPVCSYSRDGGRKWSKPAYKTYTPGGRRFKHPRAANFVWRCGNGKYLYWFHNHGGSFIRKKYQRKLPGSPYDDRNPAWLVAGIERDGPDGKVLHWSQPEILLYDDDPYIRMSYPDLVEEDGKFFVTETQKSIGRLHEIPKHIVDGLFGQFEAKTIAKKNLATNLPAGKPMPAEAKMPRLWMLHNRDGSREDHGGKDLRTGFTFDLQLELDSLEPGQIILDNRTTDDSGILLDTTDRGTLRLTLNDGRSESSWDCDPGVLKKGQRQHVTVIVDGGPKIVMFVVDGVLCDGGEHRQFGWGRYSPHLRTPRGAPGLKIASRKVHSLRIYTRALRVSEAVGNFRAGKGQAKRDNPDNTSLYRKAIQT